MITTENIFNGLNLLVLLGWVPLFIFPYSRFTKKLIDGLYLPFILCTFYIYFLSQTKGLFSADFSSLGGILDLFKNSTEESAAAGWIHYLAFDYFVGCWIDCCFFFLSTILQQTQSRLDETLISKVQRSQKQMKNRCGNDIEHNTSFLTDF